MHFFGASWENGKLAILGALPFLLVPVFWDYFKNLKSLLITSIDCFKKYNSLQQITAEIGLGNEGFVFFRFGSIAYLLVTLQS